MCNIKTFKEEASEAAVSTGSVKKPTSTASMREWQDKNLNPQLKACGTLPGCRDCTTNPLTTALMEMSSRVAKQLNESDLS